MKFTSRILEGLTLLRGSVERRMGIGWAGVTQYAALSVFAEFRACLRGTLCPLPVVPGDRDRIPARFGDNTTVSGIAPPINPGALIEGLGFVDCHCCFSRCISVAGHD